MKVTKIIKAERSKVFNTITDFENLPNSLPEFFNSIKIVSKEGNVTIIEESIKMAGRDITQTTKHILTPPEKHEVLVMTGDAKGSHIVETYENVSEGTKVTVDGDFKLSGKLKLVGFIAKRKIEKNINEVMDAIAKIVEHE
ncbi:MAG: SRPBCC family protein [Thaumarchaeota archaeon]|nr:SRPBCC family protein [Nitrososphaerota archaeon]